MFYKLLSIAKNTFVETIRQPVYAVIITAAVFLFIISPSLSMYTMDDDNKMLRELGLSTLFIAGLFIATFSASASITEEIETKTILTTLSKPLPRYIFIIGKFIGVIAAIILAHYVFTIAMLMTIRHGVLSAAADTHDMTVMISASLSIGLSFAITAFLNYSYDWKFSSTAIILIAIFATISIAFLYFIDPTWSFNPAGNNIAIFDAYASILLLIALFLLAAAAIMFSTRFNILVTLSCCVGLFLLGLISDYTFGRLAESHLWAKIGKIIIPSLQVFWISDAIYEHSQVPLRYIVMAGSYGLLYTVGFLLLAIAFFERRQVG
ncbi:MAG: ABC transporter permease subunit [Sedimentisphaerales bacterium]|nr:ABC transporter permease subunit [Sedimentisphaerales bacterium]